MIRSGVIKYTFTLTLLAMMLAAASFGQLSPDSLVHKFDTYRRQTLHEKIYVHTDQDFYMTGETLWFSIYCVDGSFHKPLDVSKIAYVEILDQANTAVLQLKVEMKEGRGEGSVFLPATLNSGNYTLRAYTQWMRNFDPEFYFHQAITIVNPFVKPVFDEIKNEEINIDFFAEGGTLVNGIRSKIGFKISGKGIEFTGAVVNTKNDTILHFKPLKFGIGSFVFTPQHGEQYRAVITNPKNGNSTIAPLPAATDYGYVMSVKDSSEQFLSVTLTTKLNEPQNFAYLFVHSREIISKAEIRYLRQGKCIFLVDKNKLPEGVSNFTILNEQQIPVCERLYFSQPLEKLVINTNTDHGNYGKRKKIILQIQTRDSLQRSNPADLSISVHRTDSISHSPDENIFTYYWLTSDLKGVVESPGYYFTPGTAEAADNLMLTQGWRRFDWKTADPAFKFIPEYRGHIIRGVLKNENDSAVSQSLTYLSIPGKSVRLYGSRSNTNGEVEFEVRKLYGRHKIILETSPLSTQAAKIEIVNPFSGVFAEKNHEPFVLSPSLENELLHRSVAMQVQDIFYQGTTTPDPPSDSTAFYGKADEIYYLDSYTRFPVMEEVMREYVPGVFVRKRRDGFHFIVIDQVKGGVFSEDPMILLDGVPVFDADRIMELDPLKIKKLEVIRRKYYLGPLTMPGIVSYMTYTGDVAGIELEPGSVSLNYDGLQAHREFYSPHYETQKQRASREPDRRYLLYWNPGVATGADGNLALEFYTSDITGPFEIVIQGITKDGQVSHRVQTFTVK